MTGKIYRCFECEFWSQDMRGLVRHVKVDHFVVRNDVAGKHIDLREAGNVDTGNPERLRKRGRSNAKVLR